jgi:putative transposase
LAGGKAVTPAGMALSRLRAENLRRVRYASHADMKAASFEYSEVFYNRKRIPSSLGYRSARQCLMHGIGPQHQEQRVA